MKTCPYCGKEYPDDAALCAEDFRVLVPADLCTGGNIKKRWALTPGQIFSAGAFAVLSAFCGVGVVCLLVRVLASPLPKAQQLDALAGSIRLMVAGGAIGFIFGSACALFFFRRRPLSAQLEVERKYVSTAGLANIFLGVPVFFIFLTIMMAYDPLARRVGERFAPYCLLGIITGIVSAGLILRDHIPRRLQLPIGLLGWLLTIGFLFWYDWFRMNAVVHP